MQEQKELWRFGRERIGSVLRRLRKEAGLKTDFANPLKIRASMVRMIESGNAAVPVARISAYAAALSASGGTAVDPEALALAYTSLRSSDPGQGDRFNWPRLREDRAQAEAYLYSQLTRKAPYAEHGSSSQPAAEFEALNPIQLQLVKDIAKGIADFSSNVVTDASIARWESFNARQIRTVLAAVTCLESELSGNFFEPMRKIVETSEFESFQYLIAADSLSMIDVTWGRLKEAVLKNTSPDKKEIVWPKFQCTQISLEEFKEIGILLGSKEDKGWDAFYLYELDVSPSLMVGVFRRLPPLAKRASALTLESWQAIPMNETLPWNSAFEFRKLHQKFWRERSAITVRSAASDD